LRREIAKAGRQGACRSGVEPEAMAKFGWVDAVELHEFGPGPRASLDFDL
jgi:hypothetical protein